MTEIPRDIDQAPWHDRIVRAGRLCVPLGKDSPAELLQAVQDLDPGYQFVELRLDLLADPAPGLVELASLLEANPQRLFLVTARPVCSGGQLRGGPEEELSVLLAAAKAGFPLVDLSLESAESLGEGALQRLRAAGAAVLVSFHDFEQTRGLGEVLRRLRRVQPDLAKLVCTARTLDDSLAVLAAAREANIQDGAPVLPIAMGEAGALTRVLGTRTGAPFTFGSASEAEATAPGQITAANLRELYRVDRITPATRVFGVAGDPVRSSLSPLMFNTVFRERATDAVYLPLLSHTPEKLLRAIHALPLAGCSITMPLKQSLVPRLDSVSLLAQRIGAVNTVYRAPSGELLGENTDVAGIVVPLEQQLSLRRARVLVLGAGGAARAAVFGCLDRGAQVSVANRSPARAAELAREAGAEMLPIEQLGRDRFDVLIHATPAGMRGSATSLPLAESQLPADLVFDLVYNPLETPLLRLAREQGLETIAGVEMFLRQGARQFEIWTGEPAPLEVMSRVVTVALAARDAG